MTTKKHQLLLLKSMKPMFLSDIDIVMGTQYLIQKGWTFEYDAGGNLLANTPEGYQRRFTDEEFISEFIFEQVREKNEAEQLEFEL